MLYLSSASLKNYCEHVCSVKKSNPTNDLQEILFQFQFGDWENEMNSIIFRAELNYRDYEENITQLQMWFISALWTRTMSLSHSQSCEHQ